MKPYIVQLLARAEAVLPARPSLNTDPPFPVLSTREGKLHNYPSPLVTEIWNAALQCYPGGWGGVTAKPLGNYYLQLACTQSPERRLSHNLASADADLGVIERQLQADLGFGRVSLVHDLSPGESVPTWRMSTFRNPSALRPLTEVMAYDLFRRKDSPRVCNGVHILAGTHRPVLHLCTTRRR